MFCANIRNYASTSLKHIKWGRRNNSTTIPVRNIKGVNIVYGSLDSPFIVVDKQPGLLVQFRKDRNADSLETRLNSFGKECYFVNRVDAVTQGLMVVAFSADVASLLSKSMEKNQWLKKYRVLVPMPEWLHLYYSHFSLPFPNYPKFSQQSNILQEPNKITPTTNSKKQFFEFLKKFIPNKSPFISGDLINNKMQLYKNGVLISYYTRRPPVLRTTTTTTTTTTQNKATPKKKTKNKNKTTILSPDNPTSPKFFLTKLWDYITFRKGVIEDKIKPFLKKNPRHHSVPKGYDDSTRLAITHFELTTANFQDKYLLYQVTLETGRTHQIRAHFSESGFPLLGDSLYSSSSSSSSFSYSPPSLEEGGEEEEETQGMIGLQAFYLQFPDPCKNKLVTLELGIPSLFNSIIAK